MSGIGDRERGGRESGQRLELLKLRSALHDRVTGLSAVPVLIDRLRTLLDDREAIGVLHFEIDNLATVESLYGWQVYDSVLARIAAELQASVGEELPAVSEVAIDAVAGDRFSAFVPELANGGPVTRDGLDGLGRVVSERLERTLADDDFSGLGPRLGIRTGHALLSPNPFYRFERRIYAAIEEARSMDERISRRRDTSWSDELQAIIQDARVETVFQPVVDLRSRAVLGYEALSRGPRDSALEAPQAMFALSDRFGVAADLDRTCCQAAFRAGARCATEGKLFVNVLPQSFGRAQDVARRVDELGADGDARERIVFEFSERSADADIPAFVDTLEKLKSLGYAIALDDVGTGYSSQAILEQVRPDYLKLDVSLVHEIHVNLIKQELLHSLVRIAHRIGASVIAEGVESEAEVEALLAAGAQYGQGFLFAQPSSRVGSAGAEPGPKGH